MSKSLAKNPFILIPIVLDVFVLAIAPTAFLQWGLARGVIMIGAALGAPWLFYFVIGKALEHAARTGVDKNDSEHPDFV